MVELAVNGIVLNVKSNQLGDVGALPVMGRTLAEWSGAAIRAPYKALDWSPVINMCDKLRGAVDRAKPVTVVLYGDTPLVSANTVAVAVKNLLDNKLNALELPRGYVIKTEYIFQTDTIFFHGKSAEGEFEPVTDSETLSRVTDLIRNKILHFHSCNGVIFTDTFNTYVDCDVIIEKNVVIEPYNFLKGKTIIKSGAHIMPGNYIEDCIIAGGTRIDSSRLYKSSVGAGTTVGPFAYIRPNTAIGENCRIGDFVELKNCVIGNGTKVSHLTYIGDAELGKDCNVGCGVVFANYDGKNKYRSVVGNRVFIGSNANIVAPVEIGDRAFIAAGSTITKKVPPQALAVARARQTLVPEWTGNVYAPPMPKPAEPQPQTFNLVRFSDGIIDGTASDGQNSAQPGGEQTPGESGANNR